jgi:hypothetical protein
MAEQCLELASAAASFALRCCSPKSASRNNVGRLIPGWQLPERDFEGLTVGREGMDHVG